MSKLNFTQGVNIMYITKKAGHRCYVVILKCIRPLSKVVIPFNYARRSANEIV